MRFEGLDTRSHDTPRRHRYGDAFLDPGVPLPSALVGNSGNLEGPAHGDHQHPGPQVLNFGTGLFGGAPPADTQLQTRYDHLVITYVTSVGGYALTIPGGGFPNGLLYASPVLADATGATSVVIIQGGCSKTILKIALYSGAVESVSGGYRISYKAEGW